MGRVFLRDRLVVAASAAMDRPKDDAVVPVVLRGSSGATNVWTVMTDAGTISLKVEPILGLSSLLNVPDARMGVGAAQLPIARVSAFLLHLKEAFPNGGPEELSAYLEG